MRVKTKNGYRKVDGKAENSMLRIETDPKNMRVFLARLKKLRNPSSETKQLIRDIEFWFKVKYPPEVVQGPTIAKRITLDAVRSGIVSTVQDAIA